MAPALVTVAAMMLLRCAANSNIDQVGEWNSNPLSSFPSRAEGELNYVPRRVAEGAPQHMTVIGGIAPGDMFGWLEQADCSQMSDEQASGETQTKAFTVDSWLYGFTSAGAASCEAENMTSIYDERTCLDAWYTDQWHGGSLSANGARFTTDSTLVPGCSLLNKEIVFNRHGTGSIYDPDGTGTYYDPWLNETNNFEPRDTLNPTGYTNGPANTDGFDTPNHPTYYDPPSTQTYGSNRICQIVPRHTVELTGLQYGGTYRFCFKGNGSTTYTDMGDEMALTIVQKPTLTQTYGIKGRATWIKLASQGTASQYLAEGDVVALIPGTNADCARVTCLVINSGVRIVWCD